MIELDNFVNFIARCADIVASLDAKGQDFLMSDGEEISIPEHLRKAAKGYIRNSRQLRTPRGICLSIRWLEKASIADGLFGSLAVDYSKAQQMLGWRPPSGMEEL